MTSDNSDEFGDAYEKFIKQHLPKLLFEAYYQGWKDGCVDSRNTGKSQMEG